ncbi:MAG: NAD(P)-dependent oxidoreductase [Elusimicrobia bacterium]|nr:NAD(P)-dependent oxidoreductase [Elusimicrobiota bacterium]
MSVPPRIGFIGLGIMGAPMAARLAKAGYEVCVYNRTRVSTAQFPDMGCEVASTPRALAKMVDTVITMVADVNAMGAVMEGPEGVASAFSGGNSLINMATLPPDYTEALARRCFTAGVRFLDCPVSGSRQAAESGELVILAGASQEDLEKFGPLLRTMAREIVHAGPPPAGSALKLCVNLVLGQLNTALAEAAALAQAQGLDGGLLFEALGHNPALNCGFFRLKKENVLSRRYPAAFPLRHMLKDSRFMLEEAAKRGLELPVTAAVEKLLAKSYNSGYGDEDLTVILRNLTEKLPREDK